MNDEIAMTFTITKEEHEFIHKWHAEQQKAAITAGKARSEAEVLGGDGDTVYYGPIGGGLSYCFYGTSLGDILVVKDEHLGVELNVTSAMDWKNFG